MARIVDFFDGAQSETTPTIGNIVASDLITYANDAAYEAAEAGSPAEGNIYFNTTDKVIRFYNGTDWISIDTSDQLNPVLIEGGEWSVVGASVTEVFNNVDNDIISDLSTLRWRGNSWESSQNGGLDKVGFAIFKTLAPTGNLTCQFYADDGSDLPGALIATSNTVDITTLGTSQITEPTVFFTFPTQPTVIASTRYHTVVNTSGITYGGGSRINYTVNNSPGANHISPGRLVVTLDGGSSWIGSTTDQDHNMQVDIIPASPTNVELTLAADAFIQIPGFENDRNTISAQTLQLGADQVAFIDINRAVDATTVLPVTLIDIDAYAEQLDRMIISRRDGGTLITVGSRMKLAPGEINKLDRQDAVYTVYDNGSSGLASENTNDAIDEVEAIATPKLDSVNGDSGPAVTLDSDDIAEGSTNLYAGGSIDTHSDVDTTTSPPGVGEVLEWDGSDWVPAVPGIASTSLPIKNYLYNGEFRFAQRQDPSATTDYSDGDYHVDRWYGLTAGGGTDVRVRRLPAESTATLAGDKVENCLDSIQQNGSSTRFGQVQFLPLADCISLRGKEVTFQFEAANILNVSDLRAGIVEWTGTADAFTKDIVSSWAATPTLIANAAFINTPADLTLAANYTEFSITVTLGTTFNNLGIFIWTPLAESVGSRFQITSCGLIEADTAINWSRIAKSKTQDLQDTQSFYCKTYDTDIPPANTSSGGAQFEMASTVEPPLMTFNYPTSMFKVPSVTLYAPGSGTIANMRDTAGGGADVAAIIVGTGQYSSTARANVAVTAGNAHGVHFTCDAEIGV